MNEFMEKQTRFPLNIQFFAEDDGGNEGGDEDNDDVDDDDVDEDLDDEDDEDDEEDKKPPKRKSKNKNRSFSQREVARISAREKRQGKKSVLSELGVDSIEDAKNIIAVYNRMIDATSSDEQKFKKASSKSKERIAEAERRAELAEARLTAIEMGVKPKFAKDIVAIAMAKADDDDDIEDIIEEMSESEAYSGFFIQKEIEDDDEDDYDDIFSQSLASKKKAKRNKKTGSKVKHSNAMTSMSGEEIGKAIAKMASGGSKEKTGKSYYFSN